MNQLGSRSINHFIPKRVVSSVVIVLCNGEGLGAGKSDISVMLVTGSQPKDGVSHKMQTVSVVFSTLHC